MAYGSDKICRRTVLKALPVAGAALLSPSAVLSQNPAEPVEITRLNWAGVKVEYKNSAAYLDVTRPEDESLMAAITSERRSRYALVTHAHPDHYGGDFLAEILGERGVIFLHEDSVISQHELREARVRLWEPFFLPRSGDDIRGFAVPAMDGFGDEQVSWVLECGGKRLIHCGDTIWHGKWWDIGAAFDGFDVACLPINGAQQNFGRYSLVDQPGTLTPEQAVAVARVIGARAIMPIHYGSPASDEYIEVENAEGRLMEAASAHGIEVRILQPGESMTIG